MYIAYKKLDTLNNSLIFLIALTNSSLWAEWLLQKLNVRALSDQHIQ